MRARGRWLVALTLVLATVRPAPAGAEEGKAKVLAPWQGEGQMFQIAPGKVIFLGRFDGILYVDEGHGGFDGVPFVCPGTQTIDMGEETMTASGYCMLTPSEEEEVFAQWSCAGKLGLCKGRLELTGGTGRFEEISGGGEMTVRTVASDLAADVARGEVVRTAAGLAVWPALSYRYPSR